MEGIQVYLVLQALVFAIGYSAIILEHSIKVNKTAAALLLAVLCWFVYFFSGNGCFHDSDFLHKGLHQLSENLSDVSQILFFLLGAMALVEVVDSHKGFNTIVEYLNTRSKRKMLCVISFSTFFLSSVLDNLTTTILMVSVLRKLIPHKKDRIFLLCMVVIAANAGGAWTPIGDVTTTMLWINGQITTLKVMKDLFIPSMISMLVPLLFYSFYMKGRFDSSDVAIQKETPEPGSKVVFYLGVLALVSVPLFKWATGMPPFMGILIALGILWVVTDLMHRKHEKREHLRVAYILTKIDIANVLFFLGILLSVGALQASGILNDAARFLDNHLGSEAMIATLIGLFSAVVDNVPLVAATMGMYDLSVVPTDSSLWMMIAYAAGTGGSILIIGSAAGVAMMGMENMDFFTYVRKASLPALIGYLAGMGAYLIL